MRAFQKVVQTGSIRKASDVLGLAPSSVSRQVSILERQMGTELFKRTAKGLELTHAGQIVAEYAAEVVSGFDALRHDLGDLKGTTRHIKIALVESVTSKGPADAVRRFRSAFDNVTFEFHIEPAPAVVQSVRIERCDIGISFSCALEHDIEIVARVPEPILAVLPHDHDLAERTVLQLADIAAHPLAMPDKNFGIREIIDRAAAESGLVLEPALETNAFEILRDFVRTGAGIAILPGRAALREEEADRARTIAIDHPALRESTLDIIVLKNKRKPRLVRLFIDALRVEFARETPMA